MALPVLWKNLADTAPDAELLRRFVADRDADAFAELVRRHGPVVYRVCRRLLGSSFADDAFQATFLILATRPDSVRQAGSVGSWLVGVAGRVAGQMRKRERHFQASGGRQPPESSDPRPTDVGRSPELTEQFRILDEELTRLPDRLRDPVVLCLLQGRTQEQAVAELGGSVRTIRRRLDEAKQLLRVRLERRGVVPAVAAGLSAGIGEATATVPPHLPGLTVSTVFDFLAGGSAISAPAAVIAKGVAMGSLTQKVKLAMVVMALGATALGVGVAGDDPKPAPSSSSSIDLPAPIPADPAPRPAPPVAKASRHTTDNFEVEAPTPELARTVAEHAERHRKALAKQWCGRELPVWDKPCPVRVEVLMSRSGGATTFTFNSDTKKAPSVTGMEMHLFGTLPKILTDHLPHEVMHCVLATYVGKPIPRWADEGIAVMAESAESRANHDDRCRELLKQGRLIRLKTLFELKEYPRDMMALFAQGYSVCRFLRDRPLVPAGRCPTLLGFVNYGLSDGWDKSAKLNYQFDSVDALEEAWLDWLRKQPAEPGVPRQPLPAAPILPAPPTALNDGRWSFNTATPVGRVLAGEVDFQRKAIARRWLGAELAGDKLRSFNVVVVKDGEPSPPPPGGHLTVLYRRGASAWSSSTLPFAEGRLVQPWIELAGHLEDILDNNLPREMTHFVLAEHLGKPLPKWAADGAARVAESLARQAEYDRVCRKMIEQGKLVRLSDLFKMTDAPKDQANTQAQSHSVTRYLLTRKAVFTTRAVSNIPRQADLFRKPPEAAFLAFVQLGADQGWDKAAKAVYGFADVEALEKAWIGWLSSPESRLAKDASNHLRMEPAPKEGKPPRIPVGKPAAVSPRRGGEDVQVFPVRTMQFPVNAEALEPDLRKTLTSLHLIASRDEGKTWEVVDAITPDKDHFTFNAKTDGLHWLDMALFSRDGGKNPIDVGWGSPQRKIIIDTTPPKIRISPSGPTGVKWVIEDVNLDPDGVTVEVRGEGDKVWTPFAPRKFAAQDSYDWSGLRNNQSLEVRVTVRDRAGHKGSAVQTVNADRP